jgi:hypothetical protein
LAALRPSGELAQLLQLTERWREAPAIAEMANLSKLATLQTSEFARISQTMAAWKKSPAFADMTRFSQLAALHAPNAISRISEAVAALQKSPAFADITSFSLKFANLHTTDEFTRLSQTIATWQNSAGVHEITKAMRDLPPWLRPQGFPGALMPSWQIAASLGAAGAAPASLVHDVLGALHEERPDTVAFEAVVRMVEGVDAEERYLAEAALALLRQYTSMLIEFLSSTTDLIRREGIVATITLFITISGLYVNYLSLLSSAEQTELAREQTAIARAAAASDPSTAYHEIAKHLQNLEQQVAQLDRASDPTIRIVAQPAPLRLEPHTKAPIIRKLYPDDRVRVQEVREGWALVEVYEYKSEATTTGWVNRRALRLP